MPELHKHARISRDGILATAVALLSVGLVMVASARASLDKSIWASLVWREPFGRQVFFVVAGFVLMLAVSRIAPLALERRWLWRRAALVLIVAAGVFLLLPLIPGLANAQRGSHRWFQIPLAGYAINVQPSELAKIALVVFLAWWLTREETDLRSLRNGFAPALLPIGLYVVLVGKEDFGTAALFALVGGLMLIVGGCRWGHLIATGGVGAAGMVALIALEPYRMQRLAAFLDPQADALGSGYQPLQSLKTIASGGWLGSGIGSGVQKYGYLPESHTDFIFAVICEETGILGGFLVMGLLATLVWLGWRAMARAVTPFEQMLAFGLTSLIGWQAVMNICVVLVLAPTTGISLPLVSAGGSGLLTYSVIVGLLAAVAWRGGKAMGAADGRDERVIRYGIEGTA
ncbi:MAG: FtsW/RodA/SpoVE family cell cycle protein [Planctomycetota bacterium]|jgi:cell division protein FtsW